MEEETKELKENGKCPLPKPLSNIAFFSEAALTMERARIAAQIRLAHLKNQGRDDHETTELFRRTKALEDFVDEWLKKRTGSHPTAAWLKRISGCVTTKGIIAEPVCKFIGEIDSFGKYYPAGDSWIPPYVRRAAEPGNNGDRWVWVEGIERLTTPSKLWKFASLDPNGKRRKGQLNTGNQQLKTILFRIMTLFMYKKNLYYEHYLSYKQWKRAQLEQSNIKVKRTPSGRYCPACDTEHRTKAALYCPDCGEKLAKKQEPPNLIWEGHLDFMARRHTIKLFLSHWWLVYRQALGLPVRAPYPIEHQGHTTIIDPWQMCDLDGPRPAVVPTGGVQL